MTIHQTKVPTIHQAKVPCGSLGTGQKPYAKDVPTVDLYGPHMSSQGVEIVIPIEAYTRLVNWASVRRTLNGVLDQNEDSLDELNDIADALAQCHEAIRRHWGTVK